MRESSLVVSCSWSEVIVSIEFSTDDNFCRMDDSLSDIRLRSVVIIWQALRAWQGLMSIHEEQVNECVGLVLEERLGPGEHSGWNLRKQTPSHSRGILWIGSPQSSQLENEDILN